MTVPTESSPRRVVEQSIMVAEGATPPGPLSDREAVRRLVEEIVQTMLEREFVQFLGAARYERTLERRGVRNGRRRRALVTRVAVSRSRSRGTARGAFSRRSSDATSGMSRRCCSP